MSEFQMNHHYIKRIVEKIYKIGGEEMLKKLILGILFSMMLLMTGCSDSEEKTLTEEAGTYTNGCKVVNLLDENAYNKNGKKLAGILQDSLDNEEEKVYYVELEEGLFSSGYKQTLEENELIYYGDLKDGKPDGYGVLYNDFLPIYIGEFKEGNYEGYGVTLGYDYAGSIYIVHEGEFKKGERAKGKGILLYDFEYLDSILEIDEELLQSEDELAVFRTIPEYIGDMTEDYPDGEGTFYYIDGTVQYTGEVKNGKYHGKGKEYYPDGTLRYEGEFSRGSYHGKGTLYDENGNEIYKGQFKNGDCA